tara:strand:- start:22 stop:474 length:453 start_codon:yes stop_codon:yes gene_type:complete
MATGFYTGREGFLKVADKKVAKIRDWSIETSLELLSTNTIDSSFNTFEPGVVGATGSATLMYYKLSTGEDNTQFTVLLNKIMKTSTDGVVGGDGPTGDRVALELNVGTANADRIKCNAYITSASVSVGTGELSVVSITFTVDGAFTELIS